MVKLVFETRPLPWLRHGSSRRFQLYENCLSTAQITIMHSTCNMDYFDVAFLVTTPDFVCSSHPACKMIEGCLAECSCSVVQTEFDVGVLASCYGPFFHPVVLNM
jgi:hypothetical protein